MSLEQLKDFIDMYANIGTYICVFAVVLIVSYITHRVQAIYDFRRHREYHIESCASSFAFSLIVAFCWPITVVMFSFIFLKYIIDIIIDCIVNRILQK